MLLFLMLSMWIKIYLFLYLTGEPAQSYPEGIRRPAGTKELGPITLPLSITAPSKTTDECPTVAWSSITQDYKTHPDSTLTWLPVYLIISLNIEQIYRYLSKVNIF